MFRRVSGMGYLLAVEPALRPTGRTGGKMHPIREDSIKSRLTEHAELALIVDMLAARDLSEDQIVIELSRRFYVDMDALNAVFDNRRALRAQKQAPRQPIRAVA
ncbi:hypothetical protein [Nitratireductor thuwali]|uniref:Uncharacterized protein n=1 Tax=Nitratireductor thuwali TaxID=2267699 RepID=A0ABY5MGE9_9HYPH|nr:hypothetical protein NTH_00721 [Nitratireductor thuwali]